MLISGGMKLARILLLSLLGAAAAVPASALDEREAAASVAIAVGFESLVKDADAVAVIVAQESKSVWEDGRIVTYTRVKVEQGVAGDLGAGSEGWVRTLGGTVGRIGQLVDGEPNLAGGKPSLVFLRKFKAQTTWEVSARAQGQFPVLTDEATKTKKLIRATNVGVLLPPKASSPGATGATPGQVSPQSARSGAPSAEAPPTIKLASEVLHDRALDEATREIAATFRRLHAAPTTK